MEQGELQEIAGDRSEDAGVAEKQEVKAENLSETELQEREKHQEIIRRAVDVWVEQKGITERYLDKAQLAELVRFLHETKESREAIYAITDLFGDRERYIQRPAVLVQGTGRGSVDVELYLLGWRSPKEGWTEGPEAEAAGVPEYLTGPDGTYIHDHEAAEVGIQVLDYDPVNEILYLTDHTRTAGNDSTQRRYYDPSIPADDRIYPYTQVERQFDAGSNLRVGAPYIHQFRGPKEQGKHGMAVTMHAYSVDPKAVPTEMTSAECRVNQRKAGCYKMNYFLRVYDKETGQPMLRHVGYYTILEGGGPFYMEGVVEGASSLEDLPKQKGRWIFC